MLLAGEPLEAAREGAACDFPSLLWSLAHADRHSIAPALPTEARLPRADDGSESPAHADSCAAATSDANSRAEASALRQRASRLGRAERAQQRMGFVHQLLAVGDYSPTTAAPCRRAAATDPDGSGRRGPGRAPRRASLPGSRSDRRGPSRRRPATRAGARRVAAGVVRSVRDERVLDPAAMLERQPELSPDEVTEPHELEAERDVAVRRRTPRRVRRADCRRRARSGRARAPAPSSPIPRSPAQAAQRNAGRAACATPARPPARASPAHSRASFPASDSAPRDRRHRQRPAICRPAKTGCRAASCSRVSRSAVTALTEVKDALPENTESRRSSVFSASPRRS